jgi:hypothetical protein
MVRSIIGGEYECGCLKLLFIQQAGNNMLLQQQRRLPRPFPGARGSRRRA